jgi:endonuclease YncB( thermonuclease family)
VTINHENRAFFTITRFRDGDTVDGFLECRSCGSVSRDTIRLLRIESWEPSAGTRHKANATAERLSDMFRGQRGVITTPNIRRDRYGRILADLILNGTALSVLIVEMGLAWYGVGEPEPENLSFPKTSVQGTS